MECSRLLSNEDIQAVRDFIERFPAISTLVDFEEQILLQTVRSTARIWREAGETVGVAYIDDFNNLWFQTWPGFALTGHLEDEMIGLGVACIKKRNAETGSRDTLDCSCSADDRHRIHMLESHGFKPGRVRTLQYSCSFEEPMDASPVPAGFSIRPVKGEEEVEQLVALHRAAFGTNNMSVELRRAMMSAPQYMPAMDFVAVAPNDELVAFCICAFDPDKKIGYTDPIGVHPSHQRKGLAKAIVSTALSALKESGAKEARLGTSSDNLAMQRLAGSLGFVCVSEKLWFSKVV